ncbi:MAG: hypothetical protein MR531_04520 [Lachnospiraceae bacterium]|nr:hypothetical protein [Lachnospiraceae bacterium]
MSTFTTGNEIVDAMASMQITGNVIPQIWYRQIQKDTGKPDLLAIALLADIVYWYRPQEVRDEITGQITGYRKRIAEDLLQRSYDQFAMMFGESKRSVQEAIVRLERIGVIKRVFRTIQFNGSRYNNVLYIELFPKRLFEITYPKGSLEAVTKKCNRCDVKNGLHLQKNADSVTQDCKHTYEKMGEGIQKNGRQITKNITEITTEIISSSSISPPTDEDDDDFKKQIGYKKAFAVYKDTATALYEEIRSDRSIDKADLTEQSFMELCRNVSEYSAPIRNLRPYIRTCLTNMEAGKKVKRKNSFNSHLKQGYDMAELEKNILAN